MIASNKSFKILLDLMGKKSFPTTIFGWSWGTKHLG